MGKVPHINEVMCGIAENLNLRTFGFLNLSLTVPHINEVGALPNLSLTAQESN